MEGLVTRRALLISGRSAPSNRTSTTGPITWEIFPVGFVAFVVLELVIVISTFLDGVVATAQAARGGSKWAGVLSLSADRKSTRLNSSHVATSHADFCLNT